MLDSKNERSTVQGNFPGDWGKFIKISFKMNNCVIRKTGKVAKMLEYHFMYGK